MRLKPNNEVRLNSTNTPRGDDNTDRGIVPIKTTKQPRFLAAIAKVEPFKAEPVFPDYIRTQDPSEFLAQRNQAKAKSGRYR